MSLDLLFKSKEWLEIKTGTLKTEKLLTRTEFLKEVGWEKFTEEFYQQYLKAMGQQNGVVPKLLPGTSLIYKGN